MTGSEDNRTMPFFVSCQTTNHAVTFQQQTGHLRLKMHLTTTSDNGVAHVLDDARQLVGTDMRMGVGEDVRRGAMLTEHLENLLDVATLLAAGIELAIAIGTGTSLSKTVVALTIHLLSLGDECQVLLALMDILATLQHNGPQA